MARDKAKEKSGGDPEPDDVKYGAAVEEIEQILASIDRDEIDLDELGQKVERAVELLKICRAKLKATDARVTQVLKDLAQDEAAESASDDDELAEAEPQDASGSETGEADESGDAADADDLGAPKKKPRRKRSEDEELPF